MSLRATILLNRSSRAVDDAVVTRIQTLLEPAPFESNVVVVRGDDIAAAAERAAQTGSTILIAAGGDGTVNAVASVVASSDLTLGVLPLGTLNHFAHDMGIPGDLDQAMQVLAAGRTAAIDVATVNGHTFLNNSSIGLYPRMVWEREQEQRLGRHKWTAMAVAALRVWRQYRRMTVTVEGRGYRRDVRTPFVFVGNNEYSIQGGRIDARASLSGGRLQLCMAPGANRNQMTRIVVAALLGRVGQVDGFEAVLAREVTITGRSHRLGVSLDGELVVLNSPLRYTIRPQALRVIVPPQAEGR